MRLKLVSQQDTLLGHVDVPDSWRVWLEKNRAARTYAMDRLPVYRDYRPEDVVPIANVETLTLMRAHWSQFRDAVCLVEGTIEQLERQPGCSYTPSMAYLRSQFVKE